MKSWQSVPLACLSRSHAGQVIAILLGFQPKFKPEIVRALTLPRSHVQDIDKTGDIDNPHFSYLLVLESIYLHNK